MPLPVRRTGTPSGVLPVRRVTTIPQPDYYGAFDTDLTLQPRSGSAVQPLSGYVATLRDGEGLYGAAVAVEEGTANLMGAHSPPFSSWSRTDVTLQQGMSDMSGGTEATRVIKGTVSVNDPFFSYPGAQLAAGANATYTFSIYMRADSPVAVSMMIYLLGVASYPMSVTVTNAWARYTFTQALTNTGSSSTSVGVGLRLPNGAIVDAWRPQLEQKPFATSWVLGGTTRGLGTLSYPSGLLNYDGDFTISCWQRIIDPKPRSTEYPIVNSYAGVFHGARLEVGSSGKLTFLASGNGASWEANVVGHTLVNDGAWHHVAVSVGSTITLYVDGVAEATAPRSGSGWNTGLATYVGRSPWASVVHNGLIDSLVLLNQAATADEIRYLSLRGPGATLR